MVWLNLSPIPVGRRGVIFSFKWFLTCLGSESAPCVRTSVPNPDLPDPHVFGLQGSGSGSTSQRYGSGSGSLSKNSKKNLHFYRFVTSFWLFIFEKWCKSTFKKYYAEKHFLKKSFFVDILEVNDENTCSKFDMVWLNLSPIPVGRRGIISSIKLFLPVWGLSRRPVCVPYLQSFLEYGEVGRDELLKLGPIHVAAHINVVHEALNVQGDVVRRGGHQLLQLGTKIYDKPISQRYGFRSWSGSFITKQKK